MNESDYSTASEGGENKRLPYASLASKIILSAIEDITLSKNAKSIEESHAEKAFLYLQSEEFKKHCSLIDKEPEYVEMMLNSQPGYIELCLRMKKARNIVGSKSKKYKQSSANFLSDFKKLSDIVYPHKKAKENVS